jgi:crotonobetainyl-CoA:carnitine CoA-transferase CaiB-like acyl-CoA transferase
MFGDFGADVILAEPADGHALRHEAPFVADEPGPEDSLLHGYANWNKRSIVVKDAAELAELVGSANVVVTTDLPPWTSDLAAALEKLPSDGIHLSITPHGLTGPLASVPGNNLTSCARTGWCHINGLVDEPPLQLPVHQTGYIAGAAGFVGALAALHRATGELVDLSEMEAMALTNAPWAILGQFKGEGQLERGPGGPRVRGIAGPLWKTADGLINLGFGDWAKWREAMTCLGLPDIAVDPVYEPVLGRHQKDLSPVRDALVRTLTTRKVWHVFHELAQLRCISGVVQNAADIVDNEQLAARDFFVETKLNGKSMKVPGAPTKLTASPWRLTRNAPGLDDHGESVREEIQQIETSSRTRSSRPKGSQPLSGIRVLTFTQAWSGTFATELLALLGADVVQIEGCRRPDVWRGAGAPVLEAVVDPTKKQSPLNTNGMYNSVNIDKRAITLDLKHPRGQEIFWRMVPRFDIVAENFSPHVMSSWGITLEKLQEYRKDIIFASLSGYGGQGPFSEYPAIGTTTEPMSGFSAIHGYEGDDAMNTGGLIPDPISGYHFAAAILVALNHRQRTGVGQRIDAAMIEMVAVQVGDAVLEHQASGRVPKPQGNSHPTIAPHGVYEARNSEWLVIAAETDAMWESLATHIGDPELTGDPRFVSNSSRRENRKALDEILAKWCKTRDAAEEEKSLGALGVCAARVVSFRDVYDKPNDQFNAREFFTPITHPESGTHRIPNTPWQLPGTEAMTHRHAPCFGEHSQEVFLEEAGISEDEYRELVELGVTGTERL